MVATGAAFTGEDVVHPCGVDAGFARNFGSFEPAGIDELAKKSCQRCVDRLMRIEIAFDARTREQPLKQVFGQVLFSMVTVICGSPCRCNIGMRTFSIEIVAAATCRVAALALDSRMTPRPLDEYLNINPS